MCTVTYNYILIPCGGGVGDIPLPIHLYETLTLSLEGYRTVYNCYWLYAHRWREKNASS